MALTTRNFRIGLYLEHLEEAAFLYDQCRALRADPDFSWRQLADFEARCEAHLDALVIGGPLALQVCVERAGAGEPGELFAAVSVFCRHQRAVEFSRILQGLQAAEPVHRVAVADALKRELPSVWADRCAAALSKENPALTRILLGVIAHRRLPYSPQIIAADLAADASTNSIAAFALGRLRDTTSLPVLKALSERPEAETKQQAIGALLAMGDRAALASTQALSVSSPWAQLLLGQAGGASAINALLAIVQSGRASRETAWALGLLGELKGVGALLRLLSDQDLASDAAWALYLITGAPLFGNVFVADPVQEDEMSSAELKAFREHGKTPTRADGKAFGSEKLALSLDPAVWNQWLSANAQRFEAGKRYRLGQPATPDSLLQALLLDRLPRPLRQAIADEARLRYDCDLPFESDLLVHQQLRCLRALARWVEHHRTRFAPGQWYFNAQAVD